VTWDLPTGHAVFYWPLPEAVTDRERVLLLGAAHALRMAGFPPVVEPDVAAGRRRWFVAVSAPGAPSDPDPLRRAAARLRDDPTWAAAARGTVSYLAGTHERPFVPPLAGERWMAEGQFALDAGRLEFRYGDAAFRAALESWQDDDVRRDVARLLDPEKMKVLKVEPAGS
jgi:hypothetical protein